jgi:collagen type I/II/III/V/XI/XXIV/XXVII alpha
MFPGAINRVAAKGGVMAIKTWQNASSNNWNVPGNWNGGLPGATDEADITSTFSGTSYTVGITDTESAQTVLLSATNAALWVEAGGTLTATTLHQTGGTLELSGVLQAGTVQADSGTVFGLGGTLNGVQWDGTLSPSGSHQTLSFANGLTLRDSTGTLGGELDLAGESDLVSFLNNTTLNGTGAALDPGVLIRLGGVSLTDQVGIATGDTLTIGTLATVRENGSGNNVFVGGTGTIVNQGTFAATGSNNNLAIDPTSFTNTGSITVTNGASASISGSTVAVGGTISLSGGGTISVFASGNPFTESGEISVSGTSTLQNQGNATGGGTITLAQSATAQVFGLAGTVVFLDATDLLEISNPGTFSGSIVGFQSLSPSTLDTIELVNQPVTKIDPYVGDSNSGTLTLENNSVVVAQLNLVGNYVGANFGTTAVGNNTFLTLVPCFAAGARILTERGAVPVEALHMGQRVWAHSGDEIMELRPIVWIGHRIVHCQRHPSPRQVWPVRVAARAFGTGQPKQDLFLSPDHAVFVAGVLIPIHALINETTIAQVRVPRVTYYHVELAEHAILLAEGMPAESYLDAGDRSAFANGGDRVALFPNFATFRREIAGCAPWVAAGPTINAVRREIQGARAA